MPRLLTGTFTTAAFDRSSFRQFGASPYRATPKGPPSSFAQHGAVRAFMTQRIRFTDTCRLTCTPKRPAQKGGPQEGDILLWFDTVARVLAVLVGRQYH